MNIKMRLIYKDKKIYLQEDPTFEYGNDTNIRRYIALSNIVGEDQQMEYFRDNFNFFKTYLLRESIVAGSLLPSFLKNKDISDKIKQLVKVWI